MGRKTEPYVWLSGAAASMSSLQLGKAGAAGAGGRRVGARDEGPPFAGVMRDELLAQGGGWSGEKMSGAPLSLGGIREWRFINHSRIGDQGVHPAGLPGHSEGRVFVNPPGLPGLIIHEVGAPLILIGYHRVRARGASPFAGPWECPALVENLMRGGKRFIAEGDDLRGDSRRLKPGMKRQSKGQTLAFHVFSSQRGFPGDSPSWSIAEPNFPHAQRAAAEKQWRQYCHESLGACFIHAAWLSIWRLVSD